MACSSTEEKYGYEDCRFEKDVDENFHCSICYNVLKEPRMCRNNEHVFCLACISQHLKVNSQTCPECNEHLSVYTLRRPRLVNNYLSKLKINCDYASRGCTEFTYVEDLENHVASCGFAPVVCSNENCGMKINKQDKVHHETVACDCRKANCHECEQIQEDVGRLKGSFAKLENNHDEIKRDQEEVKKEVKEVRKEVKDVKENLSKVNKDVNEVKVMMTQMLETLNMFEHLNKLPSPTVEMLNAPKEDILIAGGGERFSKTAKSTEIYSWEKGGWFEVSAMNNEHIGASSFIYNVQQLFVVGGSEHKVIETMNINELSLKWMKFPAELPYGCDDHQTVVHQQSVIHIGGFNYHSRRRSNVISELQLTADCTMKELWQMAEPREGYGAELLGHDKVLILGGEKSTNCKDALESVLEFDSTKNECKKMPSLPQPLSRMGTVHWRDKVVVLGGRNGRKEVQSDVFMYDCKTGKTTPLPSLLEKRYQCCAVITGNTIVVMGGKNEKEEILNSVECFTMGDYSTWEYLPAMNKARHRAVAEVLPSTRKYV